MNPRKEGTVAEGANGMDSAIANAGEHRLTAFVCSTAPSQAAGRRDTTTQMNRMNRLYSPALALMALLTTLTASAQSDAFATATPLTAFPATGSNVGATKEPGEANHGNNAGASSVWWSWTATGTGYYRVSLFGSDYDTTMGIYTGLSVDSTVLLTQNDDVATGTDTSSAAVIYARIGETLYLAVDGYNGAAGNIVLSIDPLPAGETPPLNDLFAFAAPLPSTASGSTTVSNLYGTREVGEPVIGNMPGGTSLWWTWMAPQDGSIEFRLTGTTTDAAPVQFSTGVAIYTGSSLDTLIPVASSGPAVGSAVQFSAAAGTTYYITGDVATITFELNTGDFALRWSPTYVETVFPSSVTWEWLHPQGLDPAFSDPDFDTTWFNPAAYDGPAFNPAAQALLGYGAIDGAPIVTNIGDPGSGLRYTAYFRREFTLAEAAPNADVLILADDGAFIYIDGVFVRSVNMPAVATDIYTQLATAAASEAAPSRVSIGSLSAGTHQIAVSVHNSAADSSDLGFSLSLIVDRTPGAVLTPAGIGTGFEEPAVGATNYSRLSNGTAEIGWTTLAGGAVQAAASHPANQGVPPTGQFFRLNNARANPFQSERVSLAGLEPAQKASIVASAKVRTFTTSGTTFEIEDDLTVSLQTSTDGAAFTTVADILPLTSGGSPDNLIAISQATGDFVTFSTVPGAVSTDSTYVRFLISGGNNSASEYIYIDDLKLEIGTVNPLADDDGDGQTNPSEIFAGTDPADPLSLLRITAFTPDVGGSVTLTFSAVAGKAYLIEYSETLIGAWSILRDDIFVAATGPATEAGLTLPAAETGFVRVRVKP
jgi:hypothetical protein